MEVVQQFLRWRPGVPAPHFRTLALHALDEHRVLWEQLRCATPLSGSVHGWRRRSSGSETQHCQVEILLMLGLRFV